MNSLSAADLRLAVDVISSVAQLGTLDEFRSGVMPQLERMIRADITGYNEVDIGGDPAVVILDPEPSGPDDSGEILARFGLQNPLIARYHATGDVRTLKWSDFVSRSELHASDIYELLYRPMETEHQIACQLSVSPRRVVGLALNRARGDFTERDRAMLDLARPVIVRTWRAARERALLQATLSASSGPGGRRPAVITLTPFWTIDDATPEAQRWLARRADREAPDALPKPIHDWMRELRSQRSGGQISLEDERVTVRFVPGGGGVLDALVIEWPPDLGRPALQRLGLTPRQAEVLSLVATGLSNADVADALHTSPVTVAKHLQRVYEKLGVTSRTAAIRRALELTAPHPADD